MAIDPLSLLSPKGPVTRSVLGSAAQMASTIGRTEAETLIAEYVAAAYENDRVVALAEGALRDKGARAYTVWKIFSEALQWMIDRPASVKVDEKGSHAYTDKQLAAMQAIVDDYKQELEDALTPPEETVSVPPVIPPTTARICLSF